MRFYIKKASAWLAVTFALVAGVAVPFISNAHEVYVLTPEQVAAAMAQPRFSLIEVFLQHIHEFIFWACVGMALVLGVFGLSLWRAFELRLFPIFQRLRPHAPTVSRISIGIAFLTAAFFQGVFGPELDLATIFGTKDWIVTLLFTVIGACILTRIYVRTAAFLGIAFFILMVCLRGSYMLTYLGYLGELIVLLLIGAQTFHKNAHLKHRATGAPAWIGHHYEALTKKFTPYAFLILRVTFGISLLYSSFYAKILNNNLALMVAASPLANHFHGVAHYLGFDPYFLVLGAAIVEGLLGIFFILGIEIRFTALFIEFWLLLSLLYFQESVWPHIILIGVPIAFIMYGYDKYSLEGRLFDRKDSEPVL